MIFAAKQIQTVISLPKKIVIILLQESNYGSFSQRFCWGSYPEQTLPVLPTPAIDKKLEAGPNFIFISRHGYIFLFTHCDNHLVLLFPLISTFFTWIRSRSLLLACSSFFCRLSRSRACCCSFCSHLMYSTEALRIVPLFQRISLPEKRKR